jgi:hypothetical protein
MKKVRTEKGKRKKRGVKEKEKKTRAIKRNVIHGR